MTHGKATAQEVDMDERSASNSPKMWDHALRVSAFVSLRRLAKVTEERKVFEIYNAVEAIC
jgi:hypothetical protein